MPGRASIFTSPDGSATPIERLRVSNAGAVTALAPLGGIGYGPGAGGAVTQATNKTTAVTIDKVTGKITMNNASLAAGATVVFTVNNAAYNAVNADTVIAHHASGGTAAAYRVEVLSVSTNAFALAVTNRTAGALGEALIINFNILKGAIT
jgi:hypothetical protein